jgi:hypothetical protein
VVAPVYVLMSVSTKVPPPSFSIGRRPFELQRAGGGQRAGSERLLARLSVPTASVVPPE